MKLNISKTAPKAVTALALAFAATPPTFSQTSYDLTSSINYSALVNGAYFFNRTSSSASGTGVFNTFLAVQDKPTGLGGDGFFEEEDGYNATDSDDPILGDPDAPLMPEVDDAKTRGLTVGALTSPVNNPVDSISYWSFGLDINESADSIGANARHLISLDKLEIYVSPTPLTDASTYGNLTAGATKIYDLDGGEDREVLLNYLYASSGSGESDMIFMLPQSATNSVSGVNANWYFYLYSQFGAKGGLYGAEAGFEEWQQVSGLNLIPPPIIPEAHTAAAGLLVVSAFGLQAWRRRQGQPQPE
jgi:hypothetical protein